MAGSAKRPAVSASTVGDGGEDLEDLSTAPVLCLEDHTGGHPRQLKDANGNSGSLTGLTPEPKGKGSHPG